MNAIHFYSVSVPPWIFAVLGLLAVYLFFVVWRSLRRGNKPEPAAGPNLRIDVITLGAVGPPADGAQLEFYNTPVRLALLVLAPVGRGSQLPPEKDMPKIVDRLLPHLMQVLAAHKPAFKRWPPQISSSGFAQAFFQNVPLPGDRGKGSPWCSIAGKFSVGDEIYLAGLVCCADRPNSLGQVTVEHEGQWLDVLRVRTSSK